MVQTDIMGTLAEKVVALNEKVIALESPKKIQAGSATVTSVAAAGRKTQTFSFPTAFDHTPNVIISLSLNTDYPERFAVSRKSRDKTSVTVSAYNSGTTATDIPIDWIAFDPAYGGGDLGRDVKMWLSSQRGRRHDYDRPRYGRDSHPAQSGGRSGAVQDHHAQLRNDKCPRGGAVYGGKTEHGNGKQDRIGGGIPRRIGEGADLYRIFNRGAALPEPRQRYGSRERGVDVHRNPTSIAAPERGWAA